MFRIACIVLLSLIIPLTLVAQPADTVTEIVVRSGTLDDADREAPLSEDVKEFLPLLETANDILTLLMAKEHRKIYDTYFGKEITSQLSFEEFRNLSIRVEQASGKMQSFKKQQWDFRHLKAGDREYLSLQKIVHFEKNSFAFVFTVHPDQPKKLIGFRFTPIELGQRQ